MIENFRAVVRDNEALRGKRYESHSSQRETGTPTEAHIADERNSEKRYYRKREVKESIWEARVQAPSKPEFFSGFFFCNFFNCSLTARINSLLITRRSNMNYFIYYL